MVTLRDIQLLARMARPLNLVLAWLTFFQATWISDFGRFRLLENPLFWSESLLLVVIMATGYWVNDVYDFRIDRINKPHRALVGAYLSTKKVLSVYFGLVFLAALASLALPIKFLLINLGAMGALGLYAHVLKRTAILGNLVVATLSSMVVLAGALLYTLRLPLLWMILFAFLANLTREVVKDAEDIRGDLRYRLRTLPIVLGIRTTKWIIAGLYLLLGMAIWVPLLANFLLDRPVPMVYGILVAFLVGLPLVFLASHLRGVYRPQDFSYHSRGLKWIFLGGLAALTALV